MAPSVATLSMNNAEVSQLWKTFFVVPIFKESAGDVNKCRPVSLACVLCRIIEDFIAYSKLFFFMFLTWTCSILLSGDFTANQIIDYNHEFYEYLQVKCKCSRQLHLPWLKIGLRFCPFDIAFKLERYGSSGKIIKWISILIEGRVYRWCIHKLHANGIKIYSCVGREDGSL